jgi:hypothetical protein
MCELRANIGADGIWLRMIKQPASRNSGNNGCIGSASLEPGSV